MKFLKNKKGSELTEKILMVAFSVAAGAAVTVYGVNIINQNKNAEFIDFNGEVQTEYVDESDASSGFNFTLKNGTYEITSYTGSEVNVVVPSEHNGTPVTRVANEVFWKKNIQTLTFGNGITYLGIRVASQCPNLTTLTLPATLETMAGGGIFSNNPSLSSVIIPNGVKEIGNSAFENCPSISSIVVPNSVERMNTEAFCGWTSNQTIYMNFHSAPSTWYEDWSDGCHANIVWLS